MGEGVAGRAGRRGGWEGGGTVHFRNCDDRPRRTTDGRSTIIIIEKVSRARAILLFQRRCTRICSPFPSPLHRDRRRCRRRRRRRRFVHVAHVRYTRSERARARARATRRSVRTLRHGHRDSHLSVRPSARPPVRPSGSTVGINVRKKNDIVASFGLDHLADRTARPAGP